MIFPRFRLLGLLWPPPCLSHPKAPPAQRPTPPVRPPWMPMQRRPEGGPCTACGIGLVDGECVASASGWATA